jgi:ankyrin repeat protein
LVHLKDHNNATWSRFIRSTRSSCRGRRRACLALKDGHADIVRELLKHGADTEHRGDGGWTALIAAARYGNPAMVEALVARGAVVGHRAQDGATALLIASRGGHLEVVRLLLANGANPNERATNAATPLVMAAQAGAFYRQRSDSYFTSP